MNSQMQPQKSRIHLAGRNTAGPIVVALLTLLLLTACGQNAGKPDSKASAPPSSAGTQNIPSIPDLPADWPGDKAPAELPEYTAGTVTAAAVDGEGVLTIKVKDTSQSDLDDYLEKLRSAGWIVASDGSEAELGLHTVRFDLQREGALLQISSYTQEAGGWPDGDIPPDIPEPSPGTLVGRVEVQETMENTWYFNYTYDGMDEAAAEGYMNSLAQKGWSGDTYQMHKSFEWKGKHYAADIEIYETGKTRTTFTCNFYLSAAEPASQAATAAGVPAAGTDASVEGAWMLGMLSDGQFNADTGKYQGGASGMGQIYTFQPDGAYTALVIYGDTIWLAGNYSVSDGVLTLTGRTAEESKDGGKTWGAPESLPDASAYFIAGTDDFGKYLLLGEEGAAPPLEDKKNAVKYRPQN